MKKNINHQIIKQLIDSLKILGADEKIISIITDWDIEQPDELTFIKLRNWNFENIDKLKSKILQIKDILSSLGTIKVMLKD